MFREAFNKVEHELAVSATHGNKSSPASYSGHGLLLPGQACDPSPDQDKMQRSFGRPTTHTAVVKTLVGLLYGLSNRSLDYTGLETLISIMEAPSWDSVLPQLGKALASIDSKIVHAIAEGLLTQAISTCHHKMLKLALDLGAEPTQRITYFYMYDDRHVLSTPVVALCNQLSQGLWDHQQPTAERMILSLLKKNPCVPDSTLLWIIGAGCHSIAEGLIRSQTKRRIDFAFPVSELEGDSWLIFDTSDSVTPLLVACSYPIQSVGKLALVRCLLERNAEADLEAMIAAAAAGDGPLVSLLHQHGAPINGSISKIGSPLSSACKAPDLPTITLLLELGASPNGSADRDLTSWEMSPLHVLARANQGHAASQASNLLLQHGADINHRICAGLDSNPRAETVLEFAIESSRWELAVQFLSANCELTGREILFAKPVKDHWSGVQRTAQQENFRQFIGALLERAPAQATVRHWSGLTVLQQAIHDEHEDMILELFEFGLNPLPSDFLHFICKTGSNRVEVCRLSSTVQMKLFLSSRISEPPISDIPIFRLILAFACPAVIRKMLDICADVYDSEGLCYLIARIASNDTISYTSLYSESDRKNEPRADSVTVHDLCKLISRRTISNRHEEWENTAVTIAARAGLAGIIPMLIESTQDNLRRKGLIPLALLKQFLIHQGMDPKSDESNWRSLGIWIRYCQMDDPNTSCSPLTAATMVAPESAAGDLVDQLLALNYQPDCWTVLVASCQGRLSILQRLKELDCWPNILDHKDRPDWCPTALQAAVYSVHVGTVRFLLDERTVRNTVNVSPCRPFCFAPPYQRDASLSHTMLPRTALQHAVEKRNMELVALLIESGADVNAPAAMRSGATALQIAAIQGSLPMMEYLIDRGADPNAAGAARHGRTALQGAAEHGRKDAVDLLLTHIEPTTYHHREQFVQAISYAEKNAQHVVAKILREGLMPWWGTDEQTLEIPSGDWETSSEQSEFYDLREGYEVWDKSLGDLPESLQIHAIESNVSFGARSEQPLIENPTLLPEADPWFLQAMEFVMDEHEGLDIGQIGDTNLYEGEFLSYLTFQEDTAAWVEGPPNLGGFAVDDMVLDEIFPDNFMGS